MQGNKGYTKIGEKEMTPKHKYRVAQVGCGARGKIHLDAFLKLREQFEIVGVCDLERRKMEELAASKGIPSDRLFNDADAMLKATQPDLFCFITQPNVPRLMFVEMAVKHKVKAIAFEKPMATSLSEASAIIQLCRKNGIRGVVSHQQKYLTSLQKVKEIVDSGRIGEVTLITASCQGSLSALGTHYVDYSMWINGFTRVKWVVGHVHGKERLACNHSSPDYTFGQIGFENDVRVIVEFGKLSKSHMTPDKYWSDNRLTVFGTKGYAWGETDGRWGALVNGQVRGEQGELWSVQENILQVLYLAELAHWLDGSLADHSCAIEHAYDGYEVIEALCISAMDHVRVDLPLETGRCGDMFARMKKELPECLDHIR